MSREQDIVLGHADEADGIEEYDNRLPRWWVGLFYGSVVVGVAYFVHYHLIAENSQAGAYAAEVAAADLRWPTPEPGSFVAEGPEAALAGKSIYEANCVACHGAELTGGIGPDLTDEVWITVALEAIVTTVSKGVLDKGMPGWANVLGPEKVSQVSAYVHDVSGGG